MPFIPAGYPDLATTAAALLAAERGGASVIEVGIPFSDPIADGPTIQEAFTVALAKKLKVEQVFETVASVRDRVSVPLVVDGELQHRVPLRRRAVREDGEAGGVQTG